jgi:transmembrane sensor
VLDERSQGLAAAAEHIDAEFGAPRIERGVKSLERRIARRRAVRGGVLGAGATSLVLLALWLTNVREPEPLATRDAMSQLETRDGSEARGIGRESVLALERDAADEVRLRLVRGKGHFEVKPNRQRRYRVRAGEVEVEVLGTAFIVERLPARAPATERTRVRVEHGVVRVTFRGGSATLHAGDEGLFPPLPEAPKPVALAADLSLEQPTPPEPERAGRGAAPQTGERWRSLARAGKHKEAFSSISKQPIDDLSGLLLAADAARLSGHPREAVFYLERLIARYPHSTSAHLSAFTLGRLALYELHEPGLAARSFAQAYELNARGPLAEDALAREAEAYHRAGDDERAKRAAERYLARYPKGARRAEVLRYAGRAAAE